MAIRNVLIVEDELILAMVNRKMVEALGYKSLAVVTNAKDALRTIEETRPDLILMDIMIEGDLDGIETAEIIRKSLNTPILFITGNSDEAVKSRAEHIANSAFLIKPVNQNMLKSFIEKIEFS